MPTETDVFTVDDPAPRGRLDVYLRDRYPEASRAEIQRLLRTGCVWVNGRPPKPAQTPRFGDVFEVRWPSPVAAEAQPEDIPIDVLHEDDDVIIINKSAELVVHPAAGHREGTLVNALLHHCRGRLSGIGGVERPGIVHRLDLGTTGCLIAAKTDAAHRSLQDQFATRRVEKIYQALVCGRLESPKGEIRAPIGRHSSHRNRMTVTAPGKPGRAAWTSYTVLERFTGATFVEAALHTGRTHQVRVHFLHLGHPLIGDATYGAKASARLAADLGLTANRQMLHARRLGFRHPRTGTWVEFNAPLPADFQTVLAWLRAAAPQIEADI